ncbi:SAM-dependent DNA methyltransferase [Azospirillum brasilense]|uniref:site-specific DNA-methyltransferase (adenine-specific) n=1 Tax=Azospirillum brasilense TaxID=192 RepID=A0A0P0ELL3_AZOBR|nr:MULTISPECIES: class I SAM-dependent DNA methyltransferase [Azospirillum]ALJ36894.1 restriction endonuclease subunit M [Azospirillum brasilense]MDW7551564.1 class I SAM-dependent DNA methyltransferase [Azospirillum brasilense]MDW7590999.1 class I SAM-dependent DNA methyltransferase [Azospirillum brasilense]MDW7632703.1 class I SAM-dependent DNA methyltransferase [Azospirillum brasilense]MDX5951483.1 class I SAM-dependent DNA methyltransferase [Azospirillum brasilense]
MNQQALSAFVWSVADLLRGDYKQSEYGRVILPLTVLRRLDCVLAPTKVAVLAEFEEKKKLGINPEPFLLRKAGQSFFNTSPLDLKTLMGDQDHIRENLFSYVAAFSPAVRDIFERFEFHAQVERLAKAGLLYQVVEKFTQVDLHPHAVDNYQMGLVFEELIRKFAELSNETAGEHFTPREVIRLMVNLLFIEDDEALSKPGVVRTIYDPTAGTGGMLSIAGEYLAEHNRKARLTVFGQELNPESYAICKADMLIKGQDVANIVFGNTLSDDGHPHKRFDYMLSNPPFGVEWKKVEKDVRKEHETQGYNGRFGPGLPRVSDGSMLFLLHLISKMRPSSEGGSRFGIVLNGSPLFTGGAGSGESEIRRYVLENDLLEAIVGLPTDMFYNTGISTYVWILSNRKPEHRKGKVQLIDAGSMWQKMRKSLGSKRKELSDAHIDEITRLFGQFVEAEQDGKPISRIFRNSDFGYRTITVERPERDEAGKIVLGTRGKQKGKPQADAKLRDTENVPLNEDVDAYFKREVLPHASDAWIDHDKTKIGYEIPFNRHFYVFTPPRSLEVIDVELKQVVGRIQTMLSEVMG